MGNFKMSGELTLFADDATICYMEEAEKQIMTKLQQDPNTIEKYLHQKALVLNSEKNKIHIIFSSYNKPNNILRD